MRKTIPALSSLPAGATIVDLSQWNGRIEHAAAVMSGVTEVIIRLGNGYAADPYALENWALFAGYDVRLHGYWNFLPTLYWDLQAKYFGAMLRSAAMLSRPEAAWLDCQTAPLLPLKQPAVPIASCLAKLERECPYDLGVYTRHEWWHRHVGRSPAWASRYLLWLAEWDPTRPALTIPDPWKDVGAELWQIGSYPAEWAPECARVDRNIRLKGP